MLLAIDTGEPRILTADDQAVWHDTGHSGGYVNTVVVWKLDRLSCSLKDVRHLMERIGKAGTGFRSLTEDIDTTTPAGRMMM